MPEFDFAAARDYLKSSIVHFSRINSKFKIVQYLQAALFAVEKQIKKKPTEKSLEYDGTYGKCPCCNTVVADYHDLFVCVHCGQALDWRAGDEDWAD